MAVNPNIALAVKGVEIADPMAMYGKIAAIQQAQNQNALAQFQLAAAQRGEAATNALSQAYQAAYNPQTGDIDPNKLRQSLATGGFGSQIPGVEKALSALQTQRLAQQKTEAELFNTSMQQIRDLWGNVRTPEDAMAVHNATHRDPIINRRLQALGVTEEMGRQQILQASQDPAKFSELVQRAQLGAAEFARLNAPPAEVRTMQTLGFPTTTEGYRQFRQAQTAPPQPRAPVAVLQGGRPVYVTPEQAVGQTPFTPASVQVLGMGQGREAPAPTITQIQDPTDPSRMITIDARRYQGGGVGSPGVIGATGKAAPAQAAAVKQEQGLSKSDDILTQLEIAYGQLKEKKAIPSEQTGVLRNVLSSVAASGPGQLVGRAVGTSAQTQRDIIQSSRNQLLLAIKDATGLSAQQLNSNMELQTWLSSLTDPTRSIEANEAILRNVRRFIDSGGKYSAKGGGQATPTPAGRGAAGGGVDTSNPLLR